MKITQIRTFHVSPRWLFLQIETDVGIDGWGEPVVEGMARSTQAVVAEMAEVLIGRDPRAIEDIWQTLYRGAYYRGGVHTMSALSGIEQALWDIKGKALNAPVYELLGGPVRDTIRTYAHAMDNCLETAPKLAKTFVDKGFDAIKIGVSAPLAPLPTPAELEYEAARILAVRDAIGPTVDLAVDFHGRLTPEASIKLINAIASAQVMFVEEPVLPENVDALAQVREVTGATIATGERLFTRWEFREVIEKQAAAVLQPDLSHAGGISEVRKIAAAAETYYVSIAPHNPLGPISLAAGLQVASAIPNFLIQEHPSLADGSDLGVGLLKRPFEIISGHIERPDGPGLGIEVDIDGVLKREYDGSWRSPHLRHADGSVADW